MTRAARCGSRSHPTLALQAFVNWDLLAVALATAATLAFFRRPRRVGGRPERSRDGGQALSRDCCSSLRRRTAARAATGSRDPALVVGRGGLDRVNLPFASRGLVGVVGVLPLQRRPPGRLGQRLVPPVPPSLRVRPYGLINLASVVLLVALVSWVWTAKRRREPDFPRWQLAFPILVLFLLVGKVYSPQFSLWLLPWLRLGAPRTPAVPRVRGRRPRGVPHAVLVLRRPHRRRRAPPVGLRDRGGDPRGGAHLVRRGVGPGAEPPLPGERPAARRAAGGARVSERRRLRDGLRPCLVVFLAARIGLSLFSVAAVGSDRAARPGGRARASRARPPRQGWHNAIDATERQDAVWYLRLADEGWSTDDASAAFFPLYPLTVRAVAWILPGRRAPRRAPRLEPGVPGGAARSVRAHAQKPSGTASPGGRSWWRRSSRRPSSSWLPTPSRSSCCCRSSRSGRRGTIDGDASRSSAPSRRSHGASASSWSRPSCWRRSGPAARGGGDPEAARATAARMAGAAAIALGPVSWFAWWGVVHHDWLAPLDAQRNWGREVQPPWVSLGHAVEFAWTYRSYWLLDLVIVSLAIGGLALALPALRPSEAVYGAFSLLLPLLGSVRGQAAALRPSFRGRGVPRAVGPLGCGAGPEAARAARDLRARGRLGDLRSPVRQLAAPVLNRVAF